MENLCGFSFYHPKWLQQFANAKIFLLVHGILGTVQGMCDIYFTVTLTTLEKQFKIRTQTIGIILSGNLISQVLLALVLSYAGGQRNRPAWIARSVLLGSVSCFLLAMPYFIFGADEESLQLTQEYSNQLHVDPKTTYINSSSEIQSKHVYLSGTFNAVESCQTAEIISYSPLLLIFLAQIALGIGTTFYFSLGQSYLDDSVKMKNSPLMQSYALSIRMLGPIFGYYLGFFTLNIYVDPSKTPTITNKDARWVGAWWLGWIILSVLLLIFSILMSLFPKKLPKRVKNMQALAIEAEQKELIEPKVIADSENMDKTRLKDFPAALKRLLTNKLLMLDYCSSIFYVLGSNTYTTYLTKYIEVQFNKSAAGATIFTGPITIIGTIIGYLASGYVMTKYKLHARKLYLWCVICGIFSVFARVLFMQISCESFDLILVNDTLVQPNECIMNNEEMGNHRRNEHEVTSTANVCFGNCNEAYVTFTIVLLVSNLLQSTGLIGNLMLLFRAVDVRDKAVSYGMGLTLVSFFAYVPAPILFGRIIDSTCNIWNEKCNERGSCQIYDQDAFRYYVNLVSVCFTSVGVFFDVLVWRNSRDLNLYG